MEGNIDGWNGSADASAGNFGREPYLYRDSEHMWRVLDGEILRECARESAEYERVLWKDREEQSRQTAIANGTCVSTLSAEEKERGNQVPAY